MPRLRRIKGRVNLTVSQGRMVYYVEGCSHVISVVTNPHIDPPEQTEQYLTDIEIVCPFCPDPPPEDPQRLKTAQQLWKEAGEP
jgi:hypothetical protein